LLPIIEFVFEVIAMPKEASSAIPNPLWPQDTTSDAVLLAIAYCQRQYNGHNIIENPD
jgi:hypothetical protein